MKLRRETVAEQSLEILRSQMLDGTLRPGDLVTEEAMARDIGISRPTMREVLSILVGDGLLTRSPKTRILHVTRISAQSIREIYIARRLLEVGGVEAAAHADDTALAPLVSATEQLAAAVAADDRPGVARADIAAHVATVAITGSSDLTDFYSRLLTKLQLAIAQVVRSSHYDTVELRDHHQVFLGLVLDRKVDEARAHLLGRLDRAEEQQLGTLEDAERAAG